MMYRIIIYEEFSTTRELATNLRRIASKIDKGKMDSSDPKFNIEEIIISEVEEELEKTEYKFGFTFEEYSILLKDAREYLERWGLNDTLYWIMEKYKFGQIEARTIISDIRNNPE